MWEEGLGVERIWLGAIRLGAIGLRCIHRARRGLGGIYRARLGLRRLRIRVERSMVEARGTT